ncbi:MAG TPA: hypothetical protein PLX89_27885, partial [Verrucomicrobiota bacterium]|nr:hypothetical protein [Verrucomicrobiota bacterium]
LNNTWAATLNGGMPLKTSESVHILGSMISSGEDPGRNIISITGFGSDAKSPAQIANAVTEAYIAHSSTNSANLKITFLEKASPALRPFRPNKPFNIICAIIGGGVLGLFVVGAMAVLSSMKPRPAA